MDNLGVGESELEAQNKVKPKNVFVSGVLYAVGVASGLYLMFIGISYTKTPCPTNNIGVITSKVYGDNSIIITNMAEIFHNVQFQLLNSIAFLVSNVVSTGESTSNGPHLSISFYSGILLIFLVTLFANLFWSKNNLFIKGKIIANVIVLVLMIMTMLVVYIKYQMSLTGCPA